MSSDTWKTSGSVPRCWRARSLVAVVDGVPAGYRAAHTVEALSLTTG